MQTRPDDWWGVGPGGDEVGHDAFLRLDLHARWQRILAALHRPEARFSTLGHVDRSRLQLRLPHDGSRVDDCFDYRSALVEGFAHVDPSALLTAILDAAQLDRHEAGAIYTDLRDLELPASIGPELRARVAERCGR